MTVADKFCCLCGSIGHYAKDCPWVRSATSTRRGLPALLLQFLVCLAPAAHAETVLQAAANHGGSLVITERRGRCPAGQFLALDLRPAGRAPAAIPGCASAAPGGIWIQWRGWPQRFYYPGGAFKLADRDLRWLD